MSYHNLSYFALFLPLVLLAYQLTPSRYRWLTLLVANYAFFFILSQFLVVWLILATLIAFYVAKYLAGMKRGDMDRKLFRKKKSNILTGGVLAILGLLLVLKYTNFFGQTFFSMLDKEYTPLNILVPAGISYYTLMGVSYLVDVKNNKYPPCEHLGKFALYMSFFPTLLEGPIARFNDYGSDLAEGKPITADNLAGGYERILWGLFKKVAIADHLAFAVNTIFTKYTNVGAMAVIGAVMCTLQLYMDFSGSIDIVIGTGEIFGIKIPENFRQPFFAKDAGDFWRRWHITLGAFLRDYVFYPVSLSKPIQKLTKWAKVKLGNTAARFIGPLIALMCVWFSNGFWHGANWTFILYGVYYFIFMAIELFIKNPVEAFYAKHGITDNTLWLRIFRFIKLFIIVCYGEMFSRADTIGIAAEMTKSMFTSFRLRFALSQLTNLGMDSYDYVTVVLCLIPVIVVSVLAEKGVDLKAKFEAKPLPVRWLILFAMIAAVVLLGAYGPGYGSVGMMYAGF